MEYNYYSPEKGANFISKAEKYWLTSPVENNLQWALAIKYVKTKSLYKAAIFEQNNEVLIALQTDQDRAVIVTGNTTIDSQVAQKFWNYFDAVSGLIAEANLFKQLIAQNDLVSKDEFGMALYQLDQLIMPTEVIGEIRLAKPNDRLLVKEWLEAFAIEINETSWGTDYGARADQMISQQTIWLYIVNNDAVGMTGSTRSAGGVACVNYVYTPPANRGRGYASQAVALLSKLLLKAHKSCCLYAELDNPVSNHIYQKLGYYVIATTQECEFK